MPRSAATGFPHFFSPKEEKRKVEVELQHWTYKDQMQHTVDQNVHPVPYNDSNEHYIKLNTQVILYGLIEKAEQ